MWDSLQYLNMQGHWAVLTLCWLGQLCVALNLRPQIANPKLATSNPTLTTIALEKPFCMFDDSLSPGSSYEVYLYAMADSESTVSSAVTDNSSKPLNTTFQDTNGGQLGPYRAALFNVPNCASPPMLADVVNVKKVSDVLKQYLFRVGDDVTCLYDPNFPGACNPPLAQDTTYRFKYLLVDVNAGVVKDQTLWSDPMKTRRVKQSSTIDTWPGRRSGGMIVITSILSTLMFILVAGFLASLYFIVMAPEEAVTETRHESRTTEQGAPRSRGNSEVGNQ
uniref:Uroplakin 3A n=1 Tax=Pelodiscus sinensis TaxID=13735 RepID=K7GHJ0_PELSI|nr:uroplakin-3a isoform X2 [Pelodiscus sinensis]|eukprot:XP_006127809.1 uroplakin-3a isoform X2 [Pelodiscus sinensis]